MSPGLFQNITVFISGVTQRNEDTGLPQDFIVLMYIRLIRKHGKLLQLSYQVEPHGESCQTSKIELFRENNKRPQHVDYFCEKNPLLTNNEQLNCSLFFVYILLISNWFASGNYLGNIRIQEIQNTGNYSCGQVVTQLFLVHRTFSYLTAFVRNQVEAVFITIIIHH